MDCAHHAAGRCRSCTLLGQPYPAQLAEKVAHCRSLLRQVGDHAWDPAVPSPQSGFRNKAKMVVAGTVEQPTLGILDPRGGGIDLRDCGLHEEALRSCLPVLADFVGIARLIPYDVATRRGELKHLLVTASPDGELMIRFVLRSTESLARIRKHLPGLLRALPSARVVSVNLLPEHKAVLEGGTEVVLTEQRELPMRLNATTLYLRPQGFFQTNTTVAAELYRRVAARVDEIAADRATSESDPLEIWDLYCGVGGFALHCAGPGRRVLGIEISAEAVAAAQRSASESALAVEFRAGDAASLAIAQDRGPDVLILNPPRRGIGPALAEWVESSRIRHVVYSSCNAASLASDLAAMPGLVTRRAQVLDMFPQTRHYEVLVLLERKTDELDRARGRTARPA